jgi:hypothetical protein
MCDNCGSFLEDDVLASLRRAASNCVIRCRTCDAQLHWSPHEGVVVPLPTFVEAVPFDRPGT